MAPHSYLPTIGLEIHVELKTKTKMFCSSKNDPDEVTPNTNICPVCLAHPGTLPTINKEAVRHVLRVGVALGSALGNYTEFDRKSYFYPDIPKGYQISQYEYPLVVGGTLNGVAVTRVHLEEDTARSTHKEQTSLVDFNRAGIPLMELVTEPVIHDPKTAGDFARELQLLLRILEVSDANLEKGEMRIEANVSVSQSEVFGTKVEVKNLNSFRSVERAIAHEVERQIGVLEAGGVVVQETRGWDEETQKTFHQRFKEGSADYRYFPEPDLPKLVRSELDEFALETLRASLPELPEETRARFVREYGCKPEDAAYIATDAARITYMNKTLGVLTKEAASLAVNYFVSDLAGEPGKLTAEEFGKAMVAVQKMTVSSRGAKDALARLKVEGGRFEDVAVVQENNTETLLHVVESVVLSNGSVVEEYRNGKEAALQFLVGQAMKASKGAGNPTLLKEMFIKKVKDV